MSTCSQVSLRLPVRGSQETLAAAPARLALIDGRGREAHRAGGRDPPGSLHLRPARGLGTGSVGLWRAARSGGAGPGVSGPVEGWGRGQDARTSLPWAGRAGQARPISELSGVGVLAPRPPSARGRLTAVPAWRLCGGLADAGLSVVLVRAGPGEQGPDQSCFASGTWWGTEPQACSF